jgi:dolichol-phosphate mannosyltransferase
VRPPRLQDALAALQAALGARVLWRMLATGAGDPVRRAAEEAADAGSVSVILPVLDEETRLAPCLEGLLAQGKTLREIVVVDGGSQDGTRALAVLLGSRDERVRVVDAGPPPPGWNGKAWGLAVGLERTSAPWVLALDADVRPDPGLAASLLAHARDSALSAFSAAPRQVVAGALEAMVHAAMLATLVYRFGLPGNVAVRVRDVQANGQCFFAKRDALDAIGGFAAGRASLCEDVSVARALAAGGVPVGFFEANGLAWVRMYDGARDAWRNWPRSLTLRDGAVSPASVALGLAEVALVQALPPAVLATLALMRASHRNRSLVCVNAALALARIATLAGMRRAYRDPPPAYWLSPLADVPVAARLVESAVRRSHAWRGRTVTRA